MKPELKQKIEETVRFFQGIVLDSVEQSFGEAKEWYEVRGRILRAFGDRGLSARLCSILESEGYGK